MTSQTLKKIKLVINMEMLTFSCAKNTKNNKACPGRVAQLVGARPYMPRLLSNGCLGTYKNQPMNA